MLHDNEHKCLVSVNHYSEVTDGISAVSDRAGNRISSSVSQQVYRIFVIVITTSRWQSVLCEPRATALVLEEASYFWNYHQIPLANISDTDCWGPLI